MTSNTSEGRQLLTSAVLAVLLVAVGGGLAAWSYWQTLRVEAERRASERRLDDISRRLRQVNVEEREILAKADYLRRLEQRGAVGPERRLDWIELIEAIRERRQLFAIDYEIAEQKPEGAALGEHQLYSSEMRFHLPLLHEGDLLVFLADLRQQAPALIRTRQCEIIRLPGGDERHPGDPNLDASCRLQWITLGVASKKGNTP